MTKIDYTMTNAPPLDTFATTKVYDPGDHLTPVKFKKLREDILDLLASEPGMYPRDIAERLGYSHLLISNVTADMADDGLIGNMQE